MFFFWNDTCDPSGNGEGRYFLGSLGFNANSFDDTFNRTFPHVHMTGDVYLVMSASDPESSSEFSPCYLIHAGIPVTSSPSPTGTPGSPTPTPTPSPSPVPTPTPSATLTPTPTAPAQVKQGDINCDDDFTEADVIQFLNYLATGERGPAPDGCPGVGAAIGDNKFLDADCDDSITPRDLLVMLIHLSGANQLDLPNGCPPVGERLT
jgi:hypothetical protein